MKHDRTQSEVEEMETAQDCQQDDSARPSMHPIVEIIKFLAADKDIFGKLMRAEDLLGEVQVAILKEEERLKLAPQIDGGNWRPLYGIRVDLGNEVFRLRNMLR